MTTEHAADGSALRHGRRWARRHKMVVLCFVAVLVCYLDRVSISVAVVPLQAEFGWSATRTGAVLSVFFLGYLLCQIPAGWAARRYGARLLLGISLLLWSLFTLATPLAAGFSFAALIGVRLLMGMGEATMFPGAYALFASWLPATERSRAVGLLFSAIPLGTLLALVSSGWIAAHFGWPWIFYAFGLLGLLFAAVWSREVEDGPGINRDDGAAGGSPLPIPWRRLLVQPPVWALIVNSFCTSWTIYVLLSWTPLYLREQHGVSLANAGFLSAAPWLVMFVMMNVAAWSADSMINRGVNVTRVRKLMQAGGLSGAAVFLLMIPCAGSMVEATLLLCGALGANAFTTAGFAPNHLDLAPDHAPVLIGITNTAGTLPGVIGVFITGWLVDTTGGYDAAFIIAALISILGSAVWLRYATAERIL